MANAYKERTVISGDGGGEDGVVVMIMMITRREESACAEMPIIICPPSQHMQYVANRYTQAPTKYVQ
jgi:hypothetical protein